jgi:peptide/nickel transport system permease protein
MAYGLLVLIGVITLVFFLFQGFGDPSRIVMGQTGDSKTRINIQKELYLIDENEKPIPVIKQFAYYLNDVSPISFHSEKEIQDKKLKGYFFGSETKLAIKVPYLRNSYQSKRNVGEVLIQALPGTIILAITAMFIAILIGIPLGVVSAIKQNTWVDAGAVSASIVGISAPSFFMGIVIVYLFGFVLQNLIGLQVAGNWYSVDLNGIKHLSLQNLILPAITLGIRPLAIITQLTRSAMLDVLEQDFIRTAYAKGISSFRVIVFHALRNALNPVVSAITGWFAELLAGAFFVEYIFGWQGIGKVTVNALEKLDYPVVMGSVLLTSLFFILVNIFSDVLYAWIDPRVKLN